MTMPPPESIAIYARISKDDAKGAEGGSVETQIARCHQRLASHGVVEADLARVRVFRDDGFSGKNTDRPGFLALQREIKAGSIKVLLFAELSRVSRDVRGFFEVSDVWRAADVKWISLRESFDTTTPHGQLIINILMALAQFEREQTVQRTRANMASRAARGLWNGGNTPWGYRTDRETPGGLAIDEREAQGVRKAFALYLEHGAADTVAKALTAQGHLTKEGKPITRWTIDHVLKNPVYIGMRPLNQRNKEDRDERLPADERYRIIQAKWSPIVEREVWDRVQSLVGQGKGRNHTTRNRVHEFVLSGLVNCSNCGEVLEGASAKSGKFLYYRHRTGTLRSCPCAAWPALVIEEAVLRRIDRYVSQPATFDALVAEANSAIADARPGMIAERDDARRRVSRLETDMANLGQRLVELPSGVSADWIYGLVQKKQVELDAGSTEVVRLDRELADLERQRLSSRGYADAFQGIRSAWKALNPHEQREVLMALFDRIELGQGELTMTFVSEPPEVVPVNASEAEKAKPGTSRYRAMRPSLRLLDSNQRPGG